MSGCPVLHVRVVSEGGRRRGQEQERRQTKNRTSRAVPMNPAVRRVLEASRQNEGFVVSRSLVSDVLPVVAERLRAEGVLTRVTQGRVHSFRHFFVSEAGRGHVGQRTLQSWVGHKDSAIIAYYFSLSDNDSQLAMQKLTALGAAIHSQDEAGVARRG